MPVGYVCEYKSDFAYAFANLLQAWEWVDALLMVWKLAAAGIAGRYVEWL